MNSDTVTRPGPLVAIEHHPLAVCAHCHGPVASPLAGCDRPECVAKDIAIEAAFKRREDTSEEPTPMSLIIHRCTRCSRPDTWHDPRKPCPGAAWDRPELIPTFDPAGHRETTVIQPGGPAGPPGVKTCACDDCITLYRTGGDR